VDRAAQSEPLGPVKWIWIGVLALAAAAAAATIVLARGNGGPAAVPPRAPLTVRASLDQDTVEFGDPVIATVTVLLDRNAVASPHVEVQQDLAPLTQLGQTRITDTTRGRLRTVTYSTRASCLDQRCISTRGTRRVALRPVVVHVTPDRTTNAVWPVLQVRPRVPAADVARPNARLRSDTSPPAVSYHVAPAHLARALEVAAAVFAAAAILLAGWKATALVRARRRAAPLTGLVRAIALVREAERRPAEDRRRALALLARLLGSRDPRLADAADELAWSAPAPTPDALTGIVTQVEHEVDGA
jgi:hypothetical protein